MSHIFNYDKVNTDNFGEILDKKFTMRTRCRASFEIFNEVLNIEDIAKNRSNILVRFLNGTTCTILYFWVLRRLHVTETIQCVRKGADKFNKN